MEILSEDMEENPLLKGMIENNESYLKVINSIIETLKLKEITIEKTDINLCELTGTIFKALKPAATAKNITLINKVNKEFVIWADYMSLSRIIMNIVSNSIESIDENKIIEVSAQRLPTATSVSIKDNGCGISQADIKNIFNKYVSNNKSGKKSVSGLGLSIVKDLVNKNYGKIYIDSKLNEYTRFVIELPNRGRNGKI
jgi:signal transduction histidine kinase